MADIGIFTIIALDNYGAVLQGYALQRQLDKLGASSELVDLRSREQNDCRIIKKIHSPTDILRNIRQLSKYKKLKKRMDAFKRFVDKNMTLGINYPDAQALVKKPLPYKMLLTGSDQTFNIKLPVFKKEYYLYFEHKLPKASYASSFGEFCGSYTAADREMIKKWLSEYKYIGIREEQGVSFAKEITGRDDIVKNADPTLLLERAEWDKLATLGQADTSGDYILFYSVLSDNWVVERVKEISKKLGMRVIACHLCNKFEIGSGFERVYAGPEDFLKLVKNARFVLTTSFHATVFSLVFHKPFCSFVLEEGNRIRSLLEAAGLSDRAETENDKKDISFEIDFSEADKRLEKERKDSIDYLKMVLRELPQP